MRLLELLLFVAIARSLAAMGSPLVHSLTQCLSPGPTPKDVPFCKLRRLFFCLPGPDKSGPYLTVFSMVRLGTSPHEDVKRAARWERVWRRANYPLVEQAMR